MARAKLNWTGDRLLAALKTLAFFVRWNNTGLTQRGLWAEVGRVCEAVMKRVTGEKGLTLERVCRHALETQGLEVTPNKLWQRVDKAMRYGETTGPEMEDRVLAAYRAVRAVRAVRSVRSGRAA